MDKKPFYIVNVTDKSVAEIYLYGFIGYSEDMNTGEFVKELRQLYNTHDVIKLRINSGGGSVYDGMAMLTAIQECNDKIEGYIEGVAGSMAFIVTMMLKKEKCYISKYARVMSHRARGGCYGTADEVRAAADEIQSCEDMLVKVIAERTGLSEEAARKKYMTDTDRWLNAQQAIKEGLYAGSYEGAAVSAPANMTDAKELVSLYGNTIDNSFIQTQNTIVIL
ncbi:MAG: Clp protease ClpP [Flavipsychrobacter sp.]